MTPVQTPDIGTAVIQIRNLHKSYGSLEVLKGVDLTAPRGHVVSLIGSSGSGKSTLLRCCNLLEDSQDGDITFEGEACFFGSVGEARNANIYHYCALFDHIGGNKFRFSHRKRL